MMEYLQRMARYNQWVNRRLYDKVQLLPAAEITKDRGAFFGSIFGNSGDIILNSKLL